MTHHYFQIISSIETEKKCIYFKKLSENAHIPTYGSEWAAGADLYSAYDCIVPAKGNFFRFIQQLEI